jgi:RNA polymerase sigma-70 factor (ECF subfamily)
MRDVLEWSADETGASLVMTRAAVNSALQRAHATLSTHLSGGRDEWTSSSNADEKALLDRLITAWERADVTALVGLLRADARFVMPPRPTWFDGRDAIEVFFREHAFAVMGTDWVLRPTAANRQPAFGVYWRESGDAEYQRFGIGVLRIEGGAIAEIALFMEQPELFASFALPATP